MKNKSKWTQEKEQFLIDNYNSMSIKELVNELGISQSAIYTKVKQLGIGKQFSWTEEKIGILKKYYPLGDWEALFKELGTTNKDCIIHKAYTLKIKMENIEWSDEEINCLIQNYDNSSTKELSILLNRSETAIWSKASSLEITNSGWSDEELERLKIYYPNHSNDYLAKKIFTNKTPCAIRTKALKMGLHKSKEKSNKVYYDKEYILNQLKQVAKDLGRTPIYCELLELGLPSEKTFNRLFGGYRKALMEANLPISAKLFGENTTYYASDGTVCYSKSEIYITEYLIKNKIKFIKEPYYYKYCTDKRFGMKQADWKVGEYFIEYFGFKGVESYDEKTALKIKFCKENNLKLIELYSKDLTNLDPKLKVLLNQNA